MGMPAIDYWFRPCDDARQPHAEWLRQACAAIATAADAMGEVDDILEIYTGTINHHPAMRRRGLISAEVVSFRGEQSRLIEPALARLGASRHIGVTKDDPIARPRLAPFGFLLSRSLVCHGWWGPANELDMEAYTAIPVVCSGNEAEAAFLAGCFGADASRPGLRDFLRAGVARKSGAVSVAARSTPPPW